MKFLKGSEEFEMFRDYWGILQENWEADDSEAYWEKAGAAIEAFYQKYQTPFAKALGLAALDEFERRAKHGK